MSDGEIQDWEIARDNYRYIINKSNINYKKLIQKNPSILIMTVNLFLLPLIILLHNIFYERNEFYGKFYYYSLNIVFCDFYGIFSCAFGTWSYFKYMRVSQCEAQAWKYAVYFRSKLAKDEGQSTQDNGEETLPKIRRKVGKPREWDWDGALLHLAALSHGSNDGLFRQDGSDPNQSDIARILSNWFIDQTDDSPSDSQLRAYGARFWQALDGVRKASAENTNGS
ncbi:hypothetical protein FHW96_000676 [Novosphingobium sp. SG751A]|uniref:hypothetical protein n=1 Tax=Novosphingobium sp. SG751A TaxID=2587000 RepID=UPI001552F00C|nr:hypothetical protein [Novosphingobium sp. SG751A]NOW44534.1 hypothetical protein [Novosphingobium sp. SG751A]